MVLFPGLGAIFFLNQPDSWPVGKEQFPFPYLHPFEEIVAYEEVPVEVGEVHGWGELGGRGHGA